MEDSPANAKQRDLEKLGDTDTGVWRCQLVNGPTLIWS